MPVMEGYDYDEYQVYITLPADAELGDIIDAGCKALGFDVDQTKEINWVDSHYH